MFWSPYNNQGPLSRRGFGVGVAVAVAEGVGVADGLGVVVLVAVVVNSGVSVLGGKELTVAVGIAVCVVVCVAVGTVVEGGSAASHPVNNKNPSAKMSSMVKKSKFRTGNGLCVSNVGPRIWTGQVLDSQGKSKFTLIIGQVV